MEPRGSRAIGAQKTVKSGRRSNRERKMALIQDVHKRVSLISFLWFLQFQLTVTSINNLSV